jgi:hypothetical protein
MVEILIYTYLKKIEKLGARKFQKIVISDIVLKEIVKKLGKQEEKMEMINFLLNIERN